MRIRGPKSCNGGPGPRLRSGRGGVNGLVRSPLALLCTDGLRYALVVLLVGNSRNVPFCSFRVDEGMGSRRRTHDR